MSGHNIRVLSESHGSVEDSIQMLTSEGRIATPVSRPLSHTVGWLIGHQYPGHVRVTRPGVVVVLPVQVGQVEHYGRALSLEWLVTCNMTRVWTLTWRCRHYTFSEANINNLDLRSSCGTLCSSIHHVLDNHSTTRSAEHFHWHEPVRNTRKLAMLMHNKIW